MLQKLEKTDKFKNIPQIDKNFQQLKKEVQSLLSKGVYEAYKAVDNLKIQTYWQIGERIVREELRSKNRADYGKYLVNNLSMDLGFSKRELYRIIKFYRLYEIVTTVSAQLSWSHYIELINIDNDKKRIFYQNKAISHSWSIKELRKQLKNRLFEQTSSKEIEEVFKTKLPTTQLAQVFKNIYDFNFIDKKIPNEKELEIKLVNNIEQFLKSLGEGFAFVGRQVPIKIAGNTHYIDLIFQHMGIPCKVLVDLKIGKLDAKDIGQMNKYVNYYRKHQQYFYEKDTIGLIICKEAHREEVIYALGDLEEKIFIAEYKIKLPSEEKIKKIIRRL